MLGHRLIALVVLALSVRLAANAPSRRLLRLDSSDASPVVPDAAVLTQLDGEHRHSLLGAQVQRQEAVQNDEGHWAAEFFYRSKRQGNGLEVSCGTYLGAYSLAQFSDDSDLPAADRGQLAELSNYSNSPTQDAFNKIYTTAYWGGNGESSSLSGAGSSWEAAQRLCMTAQHAVLRALAKKEAAGEEQTVRLLDAPSGDWFWMPTCLRVIVAAMPADASLRYQGVDISSAAVALAEKKRTSVQLRRTEIAPFKVLNLAEPETFRQEFGKDAFDVVISHDALQHNPTANVHRMIETFSKVGKHCLVVDVDRAGTNHLDIEAGSVRFIDLTQPPFCYQAACGDANPGVGGEKPENEWFALFELPLTKGDVCRRRSELK